MVVLLTDDKLADEIIDSQLETGQTSHYTQLTRCPNPNHQAAAWHGLPQGSCPGSHLDEYPEARTPVPHSIYQDMSPRIPIYWGPNFYPLDEDD